MAEFQRYQRSVQIQPTAMGNEQAQGFQSLADRLQSFSNQQGQIADRDAAKEGELSGQTAASGKSSGVAFHEGDTIRGRAFNKGALMAHAAQIQIDVRSDVANFARTNPFDIEGFDAQVEGMRKGLLTEIDPQLRPHAENEINDYVSRARSGIQDNVYKQKTTEYLSIVTTAVEGMKEDALIAASEGDIALYERKMEQISAIYAEGIKDGVLDADSVAKDNVLFSEKTDGQIMEGWINRLIESDPEKAQEEINKFAKGENTELEKDISLLPGTRDAIVSRAQTKINKIVTAQKTATTLKAKKAKSDLADFNSVIDQGHLPDEAALNLALENAQGTEYYEDLVGIQRFSYGKSSYTAFIAQTVESQANAIAQAKAKKNMSAVDVKHWERLEKVHKATIEEAKTNGLELYFKQGIIDTPLPEINFDLLQTKKIVDKKEVYKSKEEIAKDHAMVAQQFAQNVALSEKASIHYGVKVPPLTQTQAKALKHIIKEGSREEVIVWMSAITNGFGDDYTPDAMAAVFEDDTTAYAAIGGQIVTKTTHSMDVATDMLKGIDMMKDHPTLIAKDFDIKASEIIGQAYEEFPDHRKLIVNGAKALYAQYMVEAGNYGALKDNETDIEILEKALKDSTGGYADMEVDGTNLFKDDNYRIELPRNNKGEVQDADQVASWMENITVDDIEAMGGVRDMTSEDAVELINKGYVKLVSMGDGLYAVKTGREAAAVMLDPETNEPFLLDYQIGKHYETTLWITHETSASKVQNQKEEKKVKKYSKKQTRNKNK
jgi:hypothetical protein